jgi:hypothetical protein
VSGVAGNLAARIVGDASSASLMAVLGMPTISLALTNVSISGFGDSSAGFLGALQVDGLGGFSLDHVAMSGCNGVNGGAVFLHNLPGVALTGCTFKANRLLATADNPHVGGAAVRMDDCQVSEQVAAVHSQS